MIILLKQNVVLKQLQETGPMAHLPGKGVSINIGQFAKQTLFRDKKTNLPACAENREAATKQSPML